jgi:elongation factor 1-alpha
MATTFDSDSDDPFKDIGEVVDFPPVELEEGKVLPREIDEEGCVEHKMKISKLTKPRFTSLVTQLRFRLREGMGKAIYYLGITDDGEVSGTDQRLLQTSLRILKHMAKKVGQCAVLPEELQTEKGVYYKVTIVHNISY